MLTQPPTFSYQSGQSIIGRQGMFFGIPRFRAAGLYEPSRLPKISIKHTNPGHTLANTCRSRAWMELKRRDRTEDLAV